ncbi:MAG: S8 family serine peptidase [Oscillatoriaceae cyanobacterium Prado104]|jgi:subtilisin family serine protease|nr:S8 family serine peptidase [Oscillatoriaceae cyanobacterium Prado104]
MAVVNFGTATKSSAQGNANPVFNIPVTIDSSPLQDLIVPIAINPSSTATQNADFTFSPATLTFSAGTDTLTQIVTVTIADDRIAESSEIVVLDLGAIVNGIAGPKNQSKLTIASDDTIGVSVSPAETKATEGGADGSYNIQLTSQPTAPVTVTLTTDNQLQPIAPLAFAPTNWNVPQTVTVKAVDDTIVESASSATITHTVSSTDSNYNNIAVSGVKVAIEDNDAAPPPILTNPGIIVTPESGLVTTETGGTGKFTIQLNSQPTAGVQIDLRSSNDAEGVISSKTVTFNSTNWNLPQTIMVTGVDDSITDGNKNYTIFTYAAISTDINYSGLNAADVAVTNTDNEPRPNNESAVDAATGLKYKTGELLVKLKKSDASEATIQSELFTANGAIEVENLVPPNPPSNATNSTSQNLVVVSETEAIAFENENVSISNGQPDSIPEQLPQWRVVKFAIDTDLQQLKAKLASDPRVEAVELNYQLSIQDIPNDREFEELWALNNTGQTGGTAGADIGATQAWNVQKGSKNVVVAVIDSGVDYNHRDLAANIWKNPGETAGDGIDNDGNGYKDDWRGYDFVNKDSNPMDDNSHGTHIAGIIGAVGNNNIGVVGVSQNVSLMPLKVMGAGGIGSSNDIVKAINYATQNGAKVINASFAGGPFLQVMKDAIADANKKGVLFVAAAGNDGKNNDTKPQYPANYDLPNIISVAATNDRDRLASFSNYGQNSVDLAAPGENILSTTPGDRYDFKIGTSMAAPYVTGAAALLLAENPNLSAAQIKDTLMKDADKLTSLNGKTVSGGRLNIGNSFARSDRQAANKPPVFNYGETSSPWHFNNLPANRSSTFEYAFPANTFTDPDPGDKLTYTATLMDGSPLPQWLTFNPDTRTLSGESPKPQEFRVKLTATDKAGASVSDERGMLLRFGSRGVVIDGYISGATLFLDVNKNGIQDSNEPSTITDSNGEYNLDVSFENFDTNQNGEIDPAEGNLVAIGGIDTATGLPLETPVTAPSDSTVVTLLTSLVADLIDKGVAPESAQSSVKTSLALPGDIDLISFDPIEATNNNRSGGVPVLAAMVKVQNFITQTAALIDGASNAANTDIVKAVVSSMGDRIQTGGVLNLSNAADLSPIIQQAAAKIQQVDPSFDSQKITQIIPQAATVMAATNQRIDAAVSNPTATSIPEAVARVQQVTLGETSQAFKAVGAGNKTISQLVTDNTGAALDSKIQAVTLPARIATPVVTGDADLGSNSLNQILGTNSDDSLIGDSANDVLIGRSGNDSLASGLGNDRLFGGKDSDNLLGDSGDDVLFGGRGADILNGGDGNDILLGGEGDDLLDGGLGNDTSIGGSGSDRFLLTPDSGADTVVDFEVGIDKFAIANGLSFQQLEISQNAGVTLLKLASNGQLLATAIAAANSSITAADFLLV